MKSARAKLFKAVLFDLDGTLVDSAGDIAACFNKAVRCILGDKTFRVERSLIGFPVREMLLKSFPGISAEEVESVNKEFRALYDSDSYPETKLFLNTAETLSGLVQKNCLLFLVTNKPVKPTRRILDKVGLHFSGIYCPDIYPGRHLSKKELLGDVIRTNGLKKELTLMVGDSVADVEAAQYIGIAVAAAFYGYGDMSEIEKLSPDYSIGDISDLKSIVA